MSDVQGAIERSESMDTFFQILVIALLVSNVVLWIFFWGICALFKKMCKDLLEAIKEG